MAHFPFFLFHHGKTHTEWVVNMNNVTAISNDADGVRIYLVGDSVPVPVDETLEQITNILKHLEL